MTQKNNQRSTTSINEIAELEPWNQKYIDSLVFPYFESVEHCFSFKNFLKWPNASGLNTLNDRSNIGYTFVDQDRCVMEGKYYESFIHDTHTIPTRTDSWHDLFNGLIWLMFPKTKAYLNHLHVQDITASGVHPRTPLRNFLTHFDECGVVIFTDDLTFENDLKEHCWQSLFLKRRAQWHRYIVPIIVGHANYELLLNPFEGLTAKVAVIILTSAQMENYFVHSAVTLRSSTLKENESNERYLNLNASHLGIIDILIMEWLETRVSAIAAHNRRGNLTTKPKWLLAMPLLGIPYWASNQSVEYYNNTAYFMKKPSSRD